MDRFSKVVANWFALMSRQKKLAFFTTGFQQIAVVFPYLVASPAYFAGLFQLGGLMQTASAFHSVQSALSFFASSNTYRELAEWRAVIARLEGFDEAIVAARSAQLTAPFVSIDGGAKVEDIRIKALELWLPQAIPSSRSTASPLRPATACLSTAHQARASRLCSARSQASGHSAREFSLFRQMRK
jgi:putative ATP-binding cassette transporter